MTVAYTVASLVSYTKFAYITGLGVDLNFEAENSYFLGLLTFSLIDFNFGVDFSSLVSSPTLHSFSEKKKKIENCTILIPKGNSYCRRKSSARGPRFKVSSEEIDIPQRSPIQVQTKADVA